MAPIIRGSANKKKEDSGSTKEILKLNAQPQGREQGWTEGLQFKKATDGGRQENFLKVGD